MDFNTGDPWGVEELDIIEDPCSIERVKGEGGQPSSGKRRQLIIDKLIQPARADTKHQFFLNLATLCARVSKREN